MINEFQLLKINPENSSTKQKIIRILSMEWPLTAKMIYGKMQKEFGTAISYQAVHKILKELEEEKITVRKNDGYELNIEWIQKSIKSLQTIEKQYLKNSKIKLPENFQGVIELEFDSMTDLSVSTAELLLSRQLAKDSVDPTFLCVMEFGWWTLKFKFEHLELLGKMAFANPKCVAVIRKKTPFGTWIRNQYIRVGGLIPPAGTKFDIDEEIFIQGNCIIEVKFDEDTKKILEKYYSKWANSEDVFKEFGLKKEPKIHATMRITKNRQMAEYFRDIIKEITKNNRTVD